MNKITNNLTLFIVLGLLFSAAVQSKEFVASYDGFYDRLKVVNEGDFQFAQVNFYITDIATHNACLIKTGRIMTEQQTYPLNFTDHAQILLPFNKQLDKDKAVIVIEPKNDDYECQLKFQIEAREFTKNNLTKRQLFKLDTEFKELLSDLSGFFVSHLMSFLLPTQKGVILTFQEPIEIQDPAFNCKGAVCRVVIADKWENDNTDFAVSAPLVKVTPWIAQ